MTATLAPPHPGTMAAESYVTEALAVAHRFVDLDVPVFVARPALRSDGSWDPAGGAGGCGYWLPREWQYTRPDHSAVDAWRSGDALCAVGGYGLDFIDTDPRNGGTPTRDGLVGAGVWPTVYGRASTPSGGTHELVRPLGIGKGKIEPGIDVQAGTRGRSDHGFVFVAPTVRLSKTTGEIVPYTWSDLTLDEVDDRDDSGIALAGIVEDRRPSTASTPTASGAPPTASDAYATASAPRNEHTGPIPDGSRHAALFSYAGYLRARGVGQDIAERAMLSRLADCAQPPVARYPVTRAEALDKLRDAYRRYGGGTPDLEPIELDESGQRVNPLLADTLDEDQIEALPESEPLIDGLLDRGTYVVIYAEPKAGKSLFALDLAECVARGIPWNGHECRQESVLWVAAEGSRSMRMRQPAWRKARGVGKSGRFSMVRRAVPLDDPRAIADLVDLIKRHGAGFVVIDTWADSLGDADEDKSSQTRAAHRAIREQLLAATPGGRGCVVVLAHARKSPRGDGLPELRGSSAFRAAVDAAFVLVPEAGGRVLVRQTDNRDGARCEPFAFVIEDESVLRYETRAAAGYMAAPTARATVDADARRERVLKVVREHENVPDHPATTALIQRVTRMGRTTVQRHLNDLEAFGEIRREGARNETTWHLDDSESE